MKTILLSLLVLVCHLSVYSQNELTPEDKLYGLSTIWQEANYNFAFFDQVPDLDWDLEYKKAIPEVLSTTSDKEYYLVLKKFVGQLQDGHTQVYFPDEIEQTQSNLRIRITIENDEYIITDVASKLMKKLPIGSKIIKINGISINEYVKNHVRPYLASSTEQGYKKLISDHLFYGDKGDKVTIEVKTNTEYKTAKVIRNYTKYGNYINGFKDDLKPFEMYVKDNKAVIQMNSFERDVVFHEFAKVIDQVNTYDGLIIDLRNNIGGKASIGLEVAKHLVQGNQLVTLPWKSKHHIASHKAWGNSGLQLAGYDNVEGYQDFGNLDNWIDISSDTLTIQPNVKKIFVPIKILIDADTASSAENFLVYVQEEENIEIIGTPTFGSTGQPIYFPLPGNGYARICVKRNYTHEYLDIVGMGIQPDVFIENTASDLIAQNDRQLLYALK